MGRCPLQVSKLPAGAYSLWPLVFYVEEPVHVQQDCQEYELAGSCKSCTKLRVQGTDVVQLHTPARPPDNTVELV